MKDIFRVFSSHVSKIAGSPYSFAVALMLIGTWALSGIAFSFSDTWQLAINTSTTIITFLMVFLIQNTQNRDSKAMQLKLDELLRSGKGRNSLIDIEDMSDQELGWIDQEFKKMHSDYSEINPAMHKLHKKIQKAHEARKIRV